jgi:hypothetical protein
VATAPADPAAASPAEPTTTVAGDETVALADRSGVFQQVPRAAVAAARLQGATELGVSADEVRHQLIAAEAGRVELSVSTLDGQHEVTVTAVESGGSWQVT